MRSCDGCVTSISASLLSQQSVASRCPQSVFYFLSSTQGLQGLLWLLSDTQWNPDIFQRSCMRERRCANQLLWTCCRTFPARHFGHVPVVVKASDPDTLLLPSSCLKDKLQKISASNFLGFVSENGESLLWSPTSNIPLSCWLSSLSWLMNADVSLVNSVSHLSISKIGPVPL